MPSVKITSDFRLAVDIGNTHTVVGLFHGAKIQRHWRLATRKDTTVDEIAFWLRGLSTQVKAAVVGSVVPTQDAAWLGALRETFGVKPRMLDYRDCLNLKLDYEIPSQIGADRLANVLGAEALGVSEGIVIDFGTATTFDVFRNHTYLGGIICPGIQTGLRTLVQSAAKLAEPELRWPQRAVGRNTDDALRIGVLLGTVGMIESLLKGILQEQGLCKPVVLATGGLAPWMHEHTKAIHRFEPDLTLIGINHLLTGKISAGEKKEQEVKVLITGGAGFLGSHLSARLLSEGHEVICLDNFFTGSKRNVEHLLDHPHFELIRHDVTQPILLEVDRIYNLACPASPIHYQYNPVKTIKTSVMGAINMLGLAKRTRARILQASTSEVYGDPEQHPQQEGYWGHVNPIGLRSCYDEGKRVAETLFFDYHRQNKVDIRVMRIFNTYGPNMHPDDGRVVSNFVVQALKGQDITVYGNGSQTRSFCYVSDLLEGMIRLMDHPSCIGPINIGNPVEFTIRQLAEQVIALTGSKSRIVEKPLPSDDPRQRRPDISMAKKELGWEPSVQLKEGLVQTIAYFDKLLKETKT